MKRLIILLSLLSILVFSHGMVLAAANDPLGSACAAGTKAASSPVCDQYLKQQNDKNNSNPIAGPTGVLQTVTNVMALLTGIVAVIMIIVSGITFITAGGAPGGQRAGDNPSKAKKARAQLMAAVIGLVIVAMGWTIITFVVQKIIQ